MLSRNREMVGGGETERDGEGDGGREGDREKKNNGQ